MSFLPSRRFIAALALVSVVFVAAWGVPAAVWVALAVDVALAAACGLDYALAPRPRDLRLRVAHPERVAWGRRAAFRATVGLRGPRAATLVAFRDDLHPALGPVTLRERGTLRPGEAHAVEYEVAAARRGRFPLGSVTLRVAGPLGLALRQVRFPTDRRLSIVPGIEHIRRYELLAVVGRLRELGLRPSRRVGEGTAFASLREYAPGEDLRRIDWKATARRGKMILREYEAERGQNVYIVIDAGRRMTAELQGRARFEYALPAALLLAHVAGLNGDRVGLLLFADRVQTFLPPARGRAAERAIAEALTVAEPSLVEPDYPAAFRYLNLRARKRSLVVVFTDVIDELASQALVQAMLSLPRRHVVLAVALRNPDLEVWAGDRPSEPAQVFRKAAAEEMIQVRTQALAKMERAGVSVADVPPHQATPETVNRYLELKRRLRI